MVCSVALGEGDVLALGLVLGLGFGFGLTGLSWDFCRFRGGLRDSSSRSESDVNSITSGLTGT
jgi:hypothetical protein